MNKMLFAARWLLVALIAASALIALTTLLMLREQAQINAFVSDPAAFDSVPDDPRALFAQAGMLVRVQRDDEALDALTRVLGDSEGRLLAMAYYNRANINLREALAMIEPEGRDVPLIELAKQDYRSALALEPEMWDARYNLEVALRVVPEDPSLGSDFEKNVIHSERSIESKAFKVDLP